MADLRPFPFGALIRRMFRELEARQTIYDLSSSKFHGGDPERDLSVRFHGRRASSPLGPAAGPQSQMAQNLVLSWLGGSRIMELKTVQILDDLEIGRPCIDAQTVGYNIEWSQELTVPESLAEYVKGAMLIEILGASGLVPVAAGFDDVIYDMSVGYDLKGIRSEKVQTFLRGMLDAGPLVEKFRREIPDEFREYRDLDFQTRLSDTLTLSTFHGCPPDEIERIIDFLLRECHLNCIVKLNPTLLGEEEARRLLHDELGYTDLHVPSSAFENDTRWDQMVGFVERLGETADSLGLGFGVKLSNTLIVQNHRDFFPETETEMYLSGQPLHVLAMNLVGRFRQRFGNRYPISFAAGIDRGNFPDAVALGLVPVTVCTDLLRPGGYGRQRTYLDALSKRMKEVGATNVESFILRAYGHGQEALAAVGSKAEALAREGDLRGELGDERFESALTEAILRNTETYVKRASADPRYRLEKNSKIPKKIGSTLELFDCISCDKCVPVCPNDANFTYVIPPAEIPVVKLRREGESWRVTTESSLVIREKHQIGNFDDFCNDCGNCDIFCPEDGGPYVMKPRFFGSVEAFEESAPLDGFQLARDGGRISVAGRFQEREFRIEIEDGGESVHYAGPGFSVVFDPADPSGTIEGRATEEIDLTYFHIMDLLQKAIFAESDTSYVNASPLDIA